MNVLVDDFLSRTTSYKENKKTKDNTVPIFYDDVESLSEGAMISIINKLYLGLPMDIYLLEEPDHCKVVKGSDVVFTLDCFFNKAWCYPASGLIEELRGKRFNECRLPIKRRFGEIKCITFPKMGANEGKAALFIESVCAL